MDGDLGFLFDVGGLKSHIFCQAIPAASGGFLGLYLLPTETITACAIVYRQLLFVSNSP